MPLREASRTARSAEDRTKCRGPYEVPLSHSQTPRPHSPSLTRINEAETILFRLHRIRCKVSPAAGLLREVAFTRSVENCTKYREASRAVRRTAKRQEWHEVLRLRREPNDPNHPGCNDSSPKQSSGARNDHHRAHRKPRNHRLPRRTSPRTDGGAVRGRAQNHHPHPVELSF